MWAQLGACVAVSGVRVAPHPTATERFHMSPSLSQAVKSERGRELLASPLPEPRVVRTAVELPSSARPSVATCKPTLCPDSSSGPMCGPRRPAGAVTATESPSSTRRGQRGPATGLWPGDPDAGEGRLPGPALSSSAQIGL